MWKRWLAAVAAVGVSVGMSSAQAPAGRAATNPDRACGVCIEAHENFLASDALHGRGSGTRDEWIAATYIASELQSYGIQPAGEQGGYLERVPTGSRPEPVRPPTGGWTQSAPQPSSPLGWTTSVIGVLPGTDADAPVLLLSAHLDHLGVRPERAYHGDSIFNGADDDASGCTAVLELARALSLGPRPRRTVYFAFFGSEETGLVGSRYFVEHPPVPLGRIFANLEFEMIGWPDAKLPPDTLWLTGWQRSNLGPILAAAGAHLVGDPRPGQHFFCRSDNLALAEAGVVAQTISSFGLQPMYHRPDDDLAHLDLPLMTASIQSLIVPVRKLLNSDQMPAWNPGGRPSGSHPCARR